MKKVYGAVPDKLHETIRARIYGYLGVMFEWGVKGLHTAIRDGCACVIMEGD